MSQCVGLRENQLNLNPDKIKMMWARRMTNLHMTVLPAINDIWLSLKGCVRNLAILWNPGLLPQKFKVLALAFKSLHNLRPTYLKDHFSLSHFMFPHGHGLLSVPFLSMAHLTIAPAQVFQRLSNASEQCPVKQPLEEVMALSSRAMAEFISEVPEV